MPLTPQEFRQKYLELNAYYRALRDKMPKDMIPDELKQTMDALKQKYVSIVTNIEPTPEQQLIAQEIPSQPVEQPESDVDLSGITLSTKDLFNADKRTLGKLEGNINKLKNTLLVKDQDPEFYKRISAEVKLLQNENLPANARLKLVQSLQNDLQNVKRYAAEYNARIKTTEEFSKSRGQRAVAGLVAGFGNGLIKEFSLNYMDLLKESMKHAPKEAQELLKKIKKSGSFKAGENIGHFAGMLPVITAYENILKLPKIGEFIANATSKYQLPEWFARYITNTPKNLVLGMAYGATRKTEKEESRLDAIRNDAIGFALFSFLMDTMGSGFKFLKKAKSAKEIAKIIEEHSNIPPEQARTIGELYYEWQFLSPQNIKKLNEIEKFIDFKEHFEKRLQETEWGREYLKRQKELERKALPQPIMPVTPEGQAILPETDQVAANRILQSQYKLAEGGLPNAESVRRKTEAGSTEEVPAGQKETGRLRVRDVEKAWMEAGQRKTPPAEDVKTKGTKEEIKAQKEKIKIPKFKKTEDAIAFGEKHKGNEQVINNLKRKEAEIKIKIDEIKKKPKTPETFDERSKLVTEKQFYREAREVAEGKAEAKPVSQPKITPESETKAKPIETTPKAEKPVERKISLRRWVREKGGIKQEHLAEHGINWKEERGLALQVAAKKGTGRPLDDLAKTAIEEKVIPEPPHNVNPTDWFIQHLRENKKIGEHLKNVAEEDIYKSSEYIKYTYNELQKKGAIADDLTIDKFEEMLKKNKEPEKIHTGDLKVGDEFTIGGEKFKVTKHVGDELEIADGIKRRVPDTFDYITIDKGSLKKGGEPKKSILEQQMSKEQKDKFKGAGKVGKKAWHDLEERKQAYEKLKKKREQTGQKDLFYDQNEQKNLFKQGSKKKKQKLPGTEFVKGMVKNIAKDLNDPTQLSSNFAKEYKYTKEFLNKYGIELTDSEKKMIKKMLQDLATNKKLSTYEKVSKIHEFVKDNFLDKIKTEKEATPVSGNKEEWTKLNRKMHMLAHKKNISEEELHSVLKEVAGKESFKDASEKEIEKVIYEISKSPRAKYEERERKILASIKDKGLKRQYAEILKRKAKIRDKFEKTRRKANALGKEVSIFALKGGGYVKGLFGKLQDARYAFGNAEANTGLPFFDTYEKIINSARLVRHRTTQLLNGLFDGTGLKPEDVLNNRKSQARISKYLIKGEKEGLSEGELKLAENIKKSLKDFEGAVRKARFMLWMKDPVNFHIPNAKKEDLLYGKRLYFSKGEKALDEWLAKQTWGIRKNYLPSVFEHLANLEDYNTWFSRSKGFARTRRGEYYSNIPLFRALRRYYMNVLSYQHLDPLKKDLMKLLNEAHAANSDLKDLREWWKRLNGINEYTEITKFLNTVRGWAWKSILNNNMFIYARNLFQNYALLFQKLGVIPTIRNIHKTLLFSKTPKIKNLSKEELDALSEYFKFHVAELNAILNDYMFIEPEMPKFELTRKMNKILEYLPKKYAQTDLLNRAAAFRIVYENADHYLKKYIKGKISDSKLFLNTGVYNLTNTEQERLIELLAKKKYSEFKQELARRIVDNTHFKYTRYEKGLAEQAPSMQFILDTATWWKGNLQNLYKGGIERMAEGIRKRNYREAYAGLRTLAGYIVAAYGANKMMDTVLGEGKSRYGFDPFVYGLGGVGLGTTGKLFDVPNFAILTSKKELMEAIGKDVDPATAYKWAEARYSVDTLFKMIPFLDYGIRAYESLNDKANVSFWKEFKYHILKDHAHNRESIARRNAVEAWRHFIFGTDVKKLKRKPNVLNIY